MMRSRPKMNKLLPPTLKLDRVNKYIHVPHNIDPSPADHQLSCGEFPKVRLSTVPIQFQRRSN